MCFHLDAPELAGDDIPAIPESNVGNKFLQAMGWDTGSGISLFKKPGRKGLGLDVNGSNSNLGNCSDSSNNSSLFVPSLGT